MKMKTFPNKRTKDIFPSSSRQIKLVLFCGGRGSATLIHELLRWTNIQLTLIVNAYDDGLSTGALRDCVSHMLGPSDFRKNLSYLLDPYSEGQYALKNVLEWRLPKSINAADVIAIHRFSQTEKTAVLSEPLQSFFKHIRREQLICICHFLNVFFNYARDENLQFDYRDCSLGNLIFAGAYLDKQSNFNAAAKAMSELVCSRALLVNVSKGENRILVALKEDGELLATEADIVGQQSDVPIRRLFLLDKPVDLGQWQALTGKSRDEKEAWLACQERLPELSLEAEQALAEADIILYGPGTQHSSLLPSYHIAARPLQQAPALIKALVMNLEADNDIVSLSASDIIDTALKYMGDAKNHHRVMTHVLINTSCPLDNNSQLQAGHYQQCSVIYGEFANHFKKNVHNGRAVIEALWALWEKIPIHQDGTTASIFMDMHKPALVLAEFYEELLEMDWGPDVTHVKLSVNHMLPGALTGTDTIDVTATARQGHFPEIGYFFDWWHHETSEYLILLTGDGKYCFRDVMLAINLLEQSQFGAVFGSRNQSRLQFQTSLRAVYGEKKILSTLSFLGSFLISAIFALRFGIVFSDPLTGFRLFKRSRIHSIMPQLPTNNIKTSISLATYLIKNNIEIAELPVNYRTFSGFVDPYWRVRRGIKNLFSTLTRHVQ